MLNDVLLFKNEKAARKYVKDHPQMRVIMYCQTHASYFLAKKCYGFQELKKSKLIWHKRTGATEKVGVFNPRGCSHCYISDEMVLPYMKQLSFNLE